MPLHRSAHSARWQVAAELVASSRDVLDARPGTGDAPAPLVARGWASFLASIDDELLDAFEVHGLAASWPEGAPRSLVELTERAREACAVPMLVEGERRSVLRRREKPRKCAQIDAFAELVVPLCAGATRVIDVGSGHGHLTREIAERVPVPVVGLERDEVLAARARTLPSSAPPAFAVTDVVRDGLLLSRGDCVVGLHACGELGDTMVERAAHAGASVALVGCCLQKRRALSRRPMCRAGALEAPLDLPRRMLGLSNLASRDLGVEATRAENLAARERRLALNRLLSEGREPLRLGAEIDGLNRRAAHEPLPVLVARAFARRGLAVPSAKAIDDAARWARVQGAVARRWSLPRALLARVLEVFVLLDRARHLEERGYEVHVGALFDSSVSARNLALVGVPGRVA